MAPTSLLPFRIQAGDLLAGFVFHRIPPACEDHAGSAALHAMSAMALGLFSSLIIGLVISQLAKLPDPGFPGDQRTDFTPSHRRYVRANRPACRVTNRTTGHTGEGNQRVRYAGFASANCQSKKGLYAMDLVKKFFKRYLIDAMSAFSAAA